MGNCLSLSLPRLGAPRRDRVQTNHSDTSSEKVVNHLPNPETILHPYLPMSINRKYSIWLQADGIANEPQLVEAYWDKSLKRSIISKDIAESTRARVTPLHEALPQQDDSGNDYLCHATITVTWHLAGKDLRTPPQEIFYIFDKSNSDVAVRLRETIQPKFLRAEEQNDDRSFFMFHKKETKGKEVRMHNINGLTEGTSEEKRKQREYEDREKARQKEEAAERDAKLYKKHHDSGGSGGTNSHAANGVSSG